MEIFICDKKKGFYDVSIPNIDLNKDIVFVLPENGDEDITFNLDGSINIFNNRPINLSVIKDTNSSNNLKIYNKLLDIVMFTPCGLVPFFFSPHQYQSFIQSKINFERKQIIEFDTIENFNSQKISCSNPVSLFYPQIYLNNIFDKQKLVKEFPGLSLPPKTTLCIFTLIKNIFTNEESFINNNIYVYKHNQLFAYSKNLLNNK